MQWICCGCLTVIIGVVLLSVVPLVGLWFCVAGTLVVCFSMAVYALNIDPEPTEEPQEAQIVV